MVLVVGGGRGGGGGGGGAADGEEGSVCVEFTSSFMTDCSLSLSISPPAFSPANLLICKNTECKNV